MMLLWWVLGVLDSELHLDWWRKDSKQHVSQNSSQPDLTQWQLRFCLITQYWGTLINHYDTIIGGDSNSLCSMCIHITIRKD